MRARSRLRWRPWAFFGTLAAVALLVRGPAPDAAADEDLFAPYMAADASVESLSALLAAGADALSKSPGSAMSGPVTVCARSDAAASKALADDVAAMLQRGAAALASVGFVPPERPVTLVIVHVRVRGAAPLVLVSKDGGTLLARDGDDEFALTPPSPPARPEGLPLVRDLVASAQRARAWAWSQGQGAEAATLPAVVTRRLVRDALPAGARPAWAADALAAWLRVQVAPDRVPVHVCRAWSAPTPQALAKLLAPDTRAPPGANPFLARFVAALLAGRKDAPKAFDALARSTAPLDAAVQSAFGRSLADAAAASAVPAAKPADDPFPCDEQGAITCGVCKGTGHVKAACPDCAGTGATACPSCLGADGCLNCAGGGVVVAEGGKKWPCRLCNSGKTHCVACGGTFKASCRTCNGTGCLTVRCPVGCFSGRLLCPASCVAPDSDVQCPWCADPKAVVACGTCLGASYLGCDACRGTCRIVCDKCLGAGAIRVTIGAAPATSKCAKCDGHGFAKCDKCADGKRSCPTCGGDGRVARDPSRCPLCRGTGRPPAAGWDLLRGTFDGWTAEDAKASTDMVGGAVDFILASQSNGIFATRNARHATAADAAAGAVAAPTVRSNALGVWALAAVSFDLNDEHVKRAVERLHSDAQAAADGASTARGAKDAACLLSSLLASGEPPASPLAKALLDRIVRSQHGDGYWGAALDDPRAAGDPDASICVAESLRLARIRGAAPPAVVWTKLLRGAVARLDADTPSLKGGSVACTDVASGAALAIIAKEGTLGANATSFDYRTMPGVQRAAAFVDRYFDPMREPAFSHGARHVEPGDVGYVDWLLAARRLETLLGGDGRTWRAAVWRHLKSIQFADGSFESRSRTVNDEPVSATCGVILYLYGVTPPTTDAKDEK